MVTCEYQQTNIVHPGRKRGLAHKVFIHTVAVGLGLALGACQGDATRSPVGHSQPQATVTAQQSGSFHDPTTWGGVLPGPTDDVVIPSGMSVTANTVEVHSLTVNSGGVLELVDVMMADRLTVASGGAVRSDTTSTLLDIQVATITVESEAEIRSLGATDVHIVGRNNQLRLDNQGVIAAGGNVFINGGFGSDAPTSSNTVVQSVDGTIAAGQPKGAIYIVAYKIDLNDALVRAGSGAVPTNWLGESRAGNVYLGGALISLGGTTVVESGSNTTAGGTGGSVNITAFASGFNSGKLFIGPDASVLAGAPRIAECPGTSLFAATSSTIQGTVSGLGGSGCTYWDPPALALAGQPITEDEIMLIAGGSLDARLLQVSAQPAVAADQRLEIYIEPSGILDLRTLQPDHDYFRAGDEIVIYGSPFSVRTNPGTNADDYMSPAPTFKSAGAWPVEFPMLQVSDGIDVIAAPGQTRDIPLLVTNISPLTGPYFDISYSDSEGWSGSWNDSQSGLAPGDVRKWIQSITVPASAQPGDCTIYRVEVDGDNLVPDGPNLTLTTSGRICVAEPDDACANRPEQPGDRSYCTDECPCDAGEGDCDGSIEQCAPGLLCVHDVGASYGWDPEVDVCEATCHPSGLGTSRYCTEDCPCDVGEGDCDGDEQCAPGLTCVYDVGASYGWDPDIDVCEVP